MRQDTLITASDITMKVPIINLSLDDETIDQVVNVLKSGMWAESKNVHKLEKEFANYIGVKNARAVNSGTAAILCGLHALGIKRGDEVLVPSFSFIASANAVLNFGAKPIFVDVDRETFNMSVDDIPSKINERTKAIMPVHLYGLPAAMDSLEEIAEKHDLAIIEDACQAHGAMYHGKRCGSLGDIGTFSLYPTKNMFCGGEGGLITTDDDQLHERAKLYSNHGQSAKYIHSTVGFNFRMQDSNAVIARQSLDTLDSRNQKRQANASYYTESLGEITDIETPLVPDGLTHVYHQYTLKVQKRDALAKHLREHQIGFGIHYGIPIHQQQSMIDAGLSTKLPITEQLAREVISLPIHSHLEQRQLEHVTSTIKQFYM
ncbi:aminotransferase class I/II-fold pyridoxal phosphate-dependent enzyme [Candidatus Bathyarchaeota archaeon]|nr:aminotransferase class I/II-fold pyridoxal phosphate-dependent enzyme [Candidatus Bathyarchaeota archaeon]